MRHKRATDFASSPSCNIVRLYFLPPSLVLLLLLTNASYFVSGSDEDDAVNAGYCRLCERHTMCLFPFDDVGPKCIDVENGDLDPEEIRSIVHQHNVHRNNIAKGLETRGNPGPQPPSRNIMELTWDDELARIARRWVLQCIPYQKDDCRDVERFPVWQNMNILSLDATSEVIVEDLEEHRDPRIGIEEYANATATASPFMRIRFHVQSWLDEVERFDSARVGLVDLAIENETSYVGIACAMITRVGCGRATYRAYLDNNIDDTEMVVLAPEAGNNKFDSGGSRLEVLVCNYGPIDRSTPRELYDHGNLEFCPEGSLPSDEYDHLCATSSDVGGFSGEKGIMNSGWQGYVGSPGEERNGASDDDDDEMSEAGRSSAVSIALHAGKSGKSRFHALAEFLSLVLLHIITKIPGAARCW